jgi:hypothetical protein
MAPVPDNRDHASQLLGTFGFDILEQEAVEIDVHFENFEALENFGVGSGWLAPFFEPFSEEARAAFASCMTQFFPLEDTFKSVALLARKR